MKQLPQILLCVALLNSSAWGQDDIADETKKPAEKKEPASTKIETKASGVFESTAVHELSADTKQVASLVIEKIVPHGTVVRKGQAVVVFESEPVDRQLAEAEANLTLADLAMQEAELSAKQFQEIYQLDKTLAARTRRNALQDFDNFVKTDHQRQIESAEFGLKSARQSLENVMEELKQLEKMYKEDELTEESEEIVLKRARRAVEATQFRLRGTEVQTKRLLTQTIPREAEQQKDAIARQELAHAKSLKSLEVARQRKAIELAREKEKLKKQQADVKELQADRKQLVINSPIDGIVYHGQLTGGRLGDKPSSLDDGSTATNKQIVATVLNHKTMQVRVELTEKDLQHVRVGTKGTVSPTAFPDRKLSATVKSLSFVPHAANKFDCVLTVKFNKDEPAVVPGMTCSVTLVTEKKEESK